MAVISFCISFEANRARQERFQNHIVGINSEVEGNIENLMIFISVAFRGDIMLFTWYNRFYDWVSL